MSSMSSNSLFWPTNSPNSIDIKYPITYNRDNEQIFILTLEKLEPANLEICFVNHETIITIVDFLTMD